MIQAMKNKGLTPDAIKEKLAELVRAADDAGDDGDVAEAADEISYTQTGTFLARVDKDLHLYLYGETTTKRYMQTIFMEREVSGFISTDNVALKIIVHRESQSLTSYYVYQGGKYLSPTLPEGVAKPGDIVPVSIELLPLDSFVNGLPSFRLDNPALLNWVADSVTVKDITLRGGDLQIHFLQENPFSEVKDFTVTGSVTKYPGSSTNYGGAYVEFSITDYAGRTRMMRLRHNGFDTPDLQLRSVFFETVPLVSYDGFRLSIVYGSENKIATIYLKPPSEAIYTLGEMHPYSGSYLELVAGRYSKAFMLDDVEPVRSLEKLMLDHAMKYDIGRVGAEMAYVIADGKLGLKDIILEEPSKGQRDLYTRDGRVAIQARLLANVEPDKLGSAIQAELFSLVRKLTQDYDNQPQMQDGYAILSYRDADGTVRSIILEVPRQ